MEISSAIIMLSLKTEYASSFKFVGEVNQANLVLFPAVANQQFQHCSK
jgi:hypothetical protein